MPEDGGLVGILRNVNDLNIVGVDKDSLEADDEFLEPLGLVSDNIYRAVIDIQLVLPSQDKLMVSWVYFAEFDKEDS